jgi:hypothetical protein
MVASPRNQINRLKIKRSKGRPLRSRLEFLVGVATGSPPCGKSGGRHPE